MTKEELLKKLKECQELSKMDEENAHYHADEAIIEYLNDPEIAKAFELIRKWYA